MNTLRNMPAPWLQPDESRPEEEIPQSEPAANETAKPVGKWRILNAFVSGGTMRHLKSSEAAVWMVLFNYSRAGYVTTAQSHIVKVTGLSPSTVERSIKTLKKLKLIKVSRRGNNLNGEASTYRLRGSIPTARHG